MKKKIFMSTCLLFILCILLSAQNKEEGGIFDSIADRRAMIEKVNMTCKEIEVLTGVVTPDSVTFEISPISDTLKIKGEKYILIFSPIDALYDKVTYITYDLIDVGLRMPRPKRYVLEWTVENDSLYITNYNMSRGYKGDKTREDVRMDIEYLWGKRFENGKLNVNWMTSKDRFITVIDLYVRDLDKKKIYSLRFENGRFEKMEDKSYIKVINLF